MKFNVDFIYPVGSIYMSVNSINPGTLFGGTWTQIKDRFLLAAGDTYSAGATGGEATHKLTLLEMPNHNHAPSLDVDGHPFYWGGDNNGLINIAAVNMPWNAGYNGSMVRTGYTGGDQPHNNMPPYLVVYVWKRTA